MKKTVILALALLLAAALPLAGCELLDQPFPEETETDSSILIDPEKTDSETAAGTAAETAAETEADTADPYEGLSSAERRILQYYIDGHETADIPDLAFISIHTVKKHNRSIYQKLDVASRDELMLYIEMFRCCDRLHELIGEEE